MGLCSAAKMAAKMAHQADNAVFYPFTQHGNRAEGRGRRRRQPSVERSGGGELSARVTSSILIERERRRWRRQEQSLARIRL